MRPRREFGPREKLRKAGNAALGVLLAAGCVAALIWIPGDDTFVWEGMMLCGLGLFYAASDALVLLPRRHSRTRPHPPAARTQPEVPPWTPPVDREFERYGEAYFISLSPRFVPRWLVHVDPRNLVGNSPQGTTLLRLVRPTVFVCAGLATWCLRKSWTVAVERRDVAGVGQWRFVLREEYGSFLEALARRAEIVEDWRDVILRDWRAGDYTARPFIDS